MSEIDEMEIDIDIEETENSADDNGKKISATGLDMSQIISVLDGVSTVYEVDKSVRSKTNEIADILMGEKAPKLATKKKKEKEKDVNEISEESKKKRKAACKKQNRIQYYLDDDLREVDHAAEKMDKIYDLLDEMEGSMFKILHNQSVEYYTPLPQTGGFKGKIMCKIRSSVRRFLEYIFASTLKQQNNLNSWIARTEEKNVNLLRKYMAAAREEYLVEIKLQEKRNQILEEKLMKHDKMLETALQEINELKQKQGVKK